jgi:2-methylaconitate cis-trans-isomerase PrpF
MRGGTSRGLFFHAADLPQDPAERDAFLLRVMGSPDPYGRQIDGLGGATSSTGKIVVISPSQRPDSDIDYLFGRVSIDAGLVDYSTSCGRMARRSSMAAPTVASAACSSRRLPPKISSSHEASNPKP